MKHLKFLLAVVLAVCGMSTAKAEIVQNYVMDFNKSISTSAHDFKVASGWGHLVSYYHDSDYNQDYYVEYSYERESGRNGSGALVCGKQGELGGSYWGNTGTTTDLLVTPKVKGNVSIYVCKYGYEATGIKFYKVTKNGDNYVKGDEITPLATPEIKYNTWNKVELPEQTEETYIGIWASNVYIDDFSADQADVVKMPGMTISEVVYKGSSTPLCNENGKFPMNFTVTIDNTGDLELTPGMENYSLSVINGSKADAVMYTFPVNVSLAVGASTSVEITGEVDGNAYPNYNKYAVRENFSNSSVYGAWVTPVPYKPILEVRGENGKMSSGEAIAYGKINQNTTKKFQLKNAGGAPLENFTVTLPEGFRSNLTGSMTLAANEEKELEITADATTPGTYSGNVVVAGTGIENFNIAVSATVLDPSKFYVTFEDQKIPAGSYIEQNWEIEQRDYTSSDNVYLLKNNRTNSDDKFVTPLLKVAEGEALIFDACRAGTYTYGEGYYLNVYYSTDRQNWTLARKITAEEMSGEKANYNYNFGKLTTFTVDNIPAGNYYIGFGAGYTCIDNIYGFEPVEVNHDVLFKNAEMPKQAMVNYNYIAKATYRNLNSKAEQAGTYTASLYFGDKVVATAEAKEIPAGEDAEFMFSYMPHEAGTSEAYVVFENKADNLAVSSPKVEVTVAEETIKSTFTIGAGTTKSSSVPISWYNADNTDGAKCDIIYPASMLKQYGLSEGAKIKYLTFRGSLSNSTSDKTMDNTTLEARVALADETTFTPCDNFESMPVTKIYNNETVKINHNEDFVTTINLQEPIVWDGTSALRVYTNIKSKDYASIYYLTDDNVMKAYYYAYSLSSPTKNPVVELDLETKAVTMSGKVTCGGNAVAGAEVVLKSDDGVIYSAKSADDGTYSMPVYQANKKYKLYATATDCLDYESEDYLIFLSDKEMNIQMKSSCVSFSGKVTYKKAPVAGAKVVLSHKNDADMEATTAADGTYTFNKVARNRNYMIKVTADKFNEYASADSIAVGEENFSCDEIELTKPTVKVTIPESGIMTFSSDKALDFSVEGLKAYVVTEVKAKNDAAYTVLAATEKVPANTGVIVIGTKGEYELECADEAAAIEKNLLVAASDAPFNATAADKGKVWSLTSADNIPMFTTGTSISIPQGGAYLSTTQNVDKIYLYEKDVPELNGINTVGCSELLDMSKPMYNLAGQKVAADYKGIVIQNGRKYKK